MEVFLYAQYVNSQNKIKKMVNLISMSFSFNFFVAVPSAKLVSAWKRAAYPPITKLEIDMFNCKTDYSTSETVADLERINIGQIEEVSRFEWLDDMKKPRDLVALLYDNALAITYHLRQAARLLMDSPSMLVAHEADLTIANEAFARLIRKSVKFADTPKVVLPQLPGFDRIGGTDAFEASLASWVLSRTSAPMHNVALRYRATEHGWAAADFHRACDHVPRLLVVARSTSGFVFGGFTAVGFGGADSYKADASAFLFTLINPHGIAPTMLPSKSGDANAVRQGSGYGAAFGGGADLLFHSNCHTDERSYSHISDFSSYADPTGKGSALFIGKGDGYPMGTMSEVLAFSV